MSISDLHQTGYLYIEIILQKMYICLKVKIFSSKQMLKYTSVCYKEN